MLVEKENEIGVSIVVISYNYGHYLEHTLECIARQTYKDYEVVMVNNGSSDNTEEVFTRFQTKYEHINTQYHFIAVNNGLPPARNVGLENCKGKWVIFNDADDYMQENCLERLIYFAEKNELDHVVGGYQNFIYPHKMLKKVVRPKYTSRWMINDLQASVFRRSIFTNNTIKFRDVYWDDYCVCMDYHLYSEKVGYIDDIVYFRAVDKNSATNIDLKKKKSNYREYLKQIVSFSKDVSSNNKLDNDDVDMISYQATKLYYTMLLLASKNMFSNQERSLIRDSYIELNSVMKQFFPNYLNNRKIVLLKRNGNKPSGRIIIYMLSRLEIIGAILPALRAYGFLSQVISFNT